MRFSAVCLIVAVVACLGGSAQAALFQGNTLAEFGTPSPTGGSIVYTINNGTFASPTSRFTTGNGAAWHSPPNSLRMVGTSFDTDTETPFNVADLTYYNGITATNSTVDEVPMTLWLEFTSPFTQSESILFSFNFEFTPNLTGNNVLDADILTPVDVDSSQAFEQSGATYTLSLLGFSSDGGTTLADEFVLPENRCTSSSLYAELTSTLQGEAVVPEPATIVIWSLLGVCVAGAYRWRRRRNG